AVAAALRAERIAVREAASFPGLGPNHLRLTARTPQENERLVDALARAVAGTAGGSGPAGERAAPSERGGPVAGAGPEAARGERGGGMVGLTVVGIGADGFGGLGEGARAALAAAPLVVGSTRQLDLLPATATNAVARRLPWPSPLEPLLDELAAGRHGDAAIL